MNPSHLNGSALALAGAILAILRRRQAIGGWLLYFFWQVLLGLALAFATTPWKQFLPRDWFDTAGYFLYVLANLPRTLVLVAVGAMWVEMVRTRGWEWVCGLRYALATYAFLTLLKLGVDLAMTPENAPLDGLSLAFPLVWMVYFGLSRRVRLVFLEKTWGKA